MISGCMEGGTKGNEFKQEAEVEKVTKPLTIRMTEHLHSLPKIGVALSSKRSSKP